MSASGPRLRTARLELVAATLELARLEIERYSLLAQHLECAAPASWPPPLNDEASQRYFLEMLETDPHAAGWAMWYIVRCDGNARELIGNGGFKGKPENGVCEIGYSLLPRYHGKGYATEAARALVAWAFTHAEVNSVCAETLCDLRASIRVMEKCGMRYAGSGTPEDGAPTVRYCVSREPITTPPVTCVPK